MEKEGNAQHSPRPLVVILSIPPMEKTEEMPGHVRQQA